MELHNLNSTNSGPFRCWLSQNVPFSNQGSHVQRLFSKARGPALLNRPSRTAVQVQQWNNETFQTAAIWYEVPRQGLWGSKTRVGNTMRKKKKIVWMEWVILNGIKILHLLHQRFIIKKISNLNKVRPGMLESFKRWEHVWGCQMGHCF